MKAKLSFQQTHFEFHLQKNKGGTAHSRPFPEIRKRTFLFAADQNGPGQDSWSGEDECDESPTKNAEAIS